jgi:hypothetical protein
MLLSLGGFQARFGRKPGLPDSSFARFLSSPRPHHGEPWRSSLYQEALRMKSHRIVHSSLFVAGTVLATSSAFAAAPAGAAATTTVTATATAAPPPQAPPPDQSTAPMNDATMQGAITVFLGLGYGWGLGVGEGVGARFQYDFLPKGVFHFQNGIHDEMGVEAGLDFFHVSYDFGGGLHENYNEFTPLAGWVWNFWLTDKLAVYPKIDIGIRIESHSYTDNGRTVSNVDHDVFPLYFEGAGGVVYRVGPVALRGEVGWEALRVGASINVL